MSAVVTTIPQIVVEQRVVLRNVSWETYERLMSEHADRSAPRFTYDNGELEIYMPTQKHEKLSRFFEILVSTVAEEREIEVISLGSTTFKKEAAKKGVEPDGCFYVQSYDKVFGVEQIDLEACPPDLVIEVDVTSPSIDKFPIYAQMNVPEIWLSEKEQIKIYTLEQGRYQEVGGSAVLLGVTSQILNEFLNASQTEKRSVWLKKVREWARSN